VPRRLPASLGSAARPSLGFRGSPDPSQVPALGAVVMYATRLHRAGEA